MNQDLGLSALPLFLLLSSSSYYYCAHIISEDKDHSDKLTNAMSTKREIEKQLVALQAQMEQRKAQVKEEGESELKRLKGEGEKTGGSIIEMQKQVKGK